MDLTSTGKALPQFPLKKLHFLWKRLKDDVVDVLVGYLRVNQDVFCQVCDSTMVHKTIR
jgi:hypothetical protein